MNSAIILSITSIIISLSFLVIAIITFSKQTSNKVEENNEKIYLRQDKIKDKINFKIDKLDKDNREEYITTKTCDAVILNHRENFRRMERQLEVGFKSINETISGLNNNIVELAKRNGKNY